MRASDFVKAEKLLKECLVKATGANSEQKLSEIFNALIWEQGEIKTDITLACNRLLDYFETEEYKNIQIGKSGKQNKKGNFEYDDEAACRDMILIAEHYKDTKDEKNKPYVDLIKKAVESKNKKKTFATIVAIAAAIAIAFVLIYTQPWRLIKVQPKTTKTTKTTEQNNNGIKIVKNKNQAKETKNTTEETKEKTKEEKKNSKAETKKETKTESKKEESTTSKKEKAHTHKWVEITHEEPVYKTVHHDAVTHEEDILRYAHTGYCCAICHFKIDELTDVAKNNVLDHIRSQHTSYLSGSRSANDFLSDYSNGTSVPSGYTETVVDKEAYDETIQTGTKTVSDGYKCSICGEKK